MPEFALSQTSGPTSGTSDATGPSGFGTPTGALLFSTGGTANGTSVDDAEFAVGATDCETSEPGEAFAAGFADHNVGTTSCQRRDGTTACLKLVAARAALTFSSTITDGIRYNWDVALKNLKVNSLLFGPNCTTEVATFVAPSSEGATVDVVFGTISDPQVMIFFGTSQGMGDSDSNASLIMLGFATYDGTTILQSNGCSVSGHGQAAAQARHHTASDRCLTRPGTSVQHELELTAVSGDTVTLTCRDYVFAGGHTVGVLGVQIPDDYLAWCGIWNTPTSTGEQPITSPDFKPEIVLAKTGRSAIDTFDQTDLASNWGVVSFDDSGNGYSCTFIDEDAADPTDTSCRTSANPIELRNSNDDGDHHLVTSAPVMNSRGWTANFDTVEGTSRPWAVLAIGKKILPKARRRMI